jgi:hypothetical protein
MRENSLFRPRHLSIRMELASNEERRSVGPWKSNAFFWVDALVKVITFNDKVNMITLSSPSMNS